jgi:ATP-binding cassette subfamily B protein
LLGLLLLAGWPVTVAVIALQLLVSALPAGAALALGWVVARVWESAGVGLAEATAPALVAYAGVLVLTNAAEAFSTPLQYLAKVRIDGRRRTELARLTVSCETIEDLEDPEVQELIRLAKAEPGNWTERTPGDGALAQLTMCTGILGMIASCCILVRCGWWLVPAVVLPALLTNALRNRQGVEFMRQWRKGVREGMYADVWSKMLTEPSAGKEVRIFGYARLAAGRVRRHVLGMLGPVWAVGERNLHEQWGKFWLMAIGLGIPFTAVAAAAAHGEISVSLESAALLAAWSIFNAIAGYDARAVLGAVPGERAWAELRRKLGGDSPAPEACPADEEVASAAPSVRFEGVTFRYPGSGVPVLEHLDLEIRPGELLAIVGANGAGKSTVIKLLSGLYRPTYGRITADDTDIWQAGISQWQRRISVVFQEFAKYPLSLAANISLSAATADRARTEAAMADVIAQAGLSALVDRMPDGLDTLLARSRAGGVDLSGGQWQLVVLARALYAARMGARLLVLDEPTAHLDVRSEFEVFDRLARNRGNLSVVLISHRLSTVRAADRILLLDGGQVRECGTHDELMALNGRYALMFATQAERFAKGDEHLREGVSR